MVAQKTVNLLVVGSNPSRGAKYGAVVQLVRIPACHAGGREFESRPLRQFCGCNSVVEFFVANEDVVSSNLITRSTERWQS